MQQLWQLVPDGEYLGQLLLILHHEDVSPAMAQDVLARLGRVGRVDACCQTARKNAAQVRQEPLGAVEADDAHAVAGLEAQLDEGLESRERKGRH